MRRRQLLLIALATVLLASCGTQPKSVTQLEAIKDSHLYYPGAALVRVDAVAQEQAQTNAAPVDGFVAATLKASASQDTVLQWYRQQLSARGWSGRGREAHGDTNDGHPVPPGYLFTRGGQEVFALRFDAIAGDVITTYIALTDHCDTVPPYPLGPGDCGNGKPVS